MGIIHELRGVDRLRAGFRFWRMVRERSLDATMALADVLAQPGVVEPILARLRKHGDANAAIESRYRLRPDMAALRRLPVGTLGRAYVEHLDRNRIDPNDFPQIAIRSDVEYYRVHIYDVHDIWHALLGFNTDVPGEVGVSAFSSAQFGSRLSDLILLGAVVQGVLVAPTHELEERLNALSRGWQIGRSARCLFGVRWETLWPLPLVEVRERLGIPKHLVPTANTERAVATPSISTCTASVVD